MKRAVIIPTALGPEWLDECEIGGQEHEDVLLARLLRFTNLHITFNHHTAEEWVRINLPCCFNDSDEFITRVKERFLEAQHRAGWRTALHVDTRINPGSILFLVKPGSVGEYKFQKALHGNEDVNDG